MRPILTFSQFIRVSYQFINSLLYHKHFINIFHFIIHKSKAVKPSRAITQKNTTSYEFVIFLYYLSPATTVWRNQHLLINRAPTLNPGPCLVFLDPAKKGLRYPNLKKQVKLAFTIKLIVTLLHHLSLQSAAD